MMELNWFQIAKRKKEKMVRNGTRRSFDDTEDTVDINANIASVLQNIDNDYVRDPEEESLSFGHSNAEYVACGGLDNECTFYRIKYREETTQSTQLIASDDQKDAGKAMTTQS